MQAPLHYKCCIEHPNTHLHHCTEENRVSPDYNVLATDYGKVLKSPLAPIQYRMYSPDPLLSTFTHQKLNTGFNVL